MNFTIIVTCNTDHVSLTLANGSFVLDGIATDAYHGPLQENGQEFFHMTLTNQTLALSQRDGDFDTLSIQARVQVPDGTPYLNIGVSGRGGVGSLIITADLPSHGSVNAVSNNTTYALPLTQQAILELENKIVGLHLHGEKKK